MSNPTTPTPTTSKSSKSSSSKSSKLKSHRRKRRGSGNSNASIISIDPVSLKSLRKFQEKVAKENKKQKKLYQRQKQSQFEDYTKKFVSKSNKYELKEEDEIFGEEDDGFKVHKTDNNTSPYDISYDSSSSYNNNNNNNKQKMEDITVEELLPLIKNLVDRHNKLQQEYDILDRQLREQKLVMEDKINQLQQEQIYPAIHHQQHQYDDDDNQQQHKNQNHHSNINIIRNEYEDKIEILKNNYENNLLSIQSQYEQEMDQQKKQIKTLNKELNDADKENDALRQSLEALEHENESLRISINNNNKQFQNIKLFKNKNKQLLLENETLRQQLESLEQEMELLIQEQEEQQQHQHTQQQLLNNNNNMMNVRPQTPTHQYTKTLVMGNRDIMDVGSNRGSSHNLSDHDSSMGGNDLLHQIENYQNDENDLNPTYTPPNQSSVDPPDRDSENEEDDEEEDEEKKIKDNDSDNDDDDDDDDDDENDNTLNNLAKYKNIAAMDPDSMQQIMALLQEKENKRLQHTGHSQPSQDVIDNFSVESNYSDSEQKLEEQIDGIEDDMRELKDMVLSLMDSTNNITPQINANLGPLIRKINRMYVMLSGPIGPLQSRTSQINDDGSIHHQQQQQQQQHHHHYHLQQQHRNDGGYDTESDGYNDHSSQQSVRTKYSNDHHHHDNNNRNNKQQHESNWIGWLMPYMNDWIPSIGFSAIILSTMYLLIKYHKGRIIGIGQPRVLRNKRK